MSIAVAAPRIVPTSPRRTRTVAPGSRPPLHGPLARPGAAPSPGSTRRVAACSVQGRPRRELVLKLKVVLVSVLALAGMGASVAEFATWATPDPAVEYVQGDPAWAHVDGN